MRNLRSQWRSFTRFCDQFTLVPLPASPQTLFAYVSFLTCRTSSFNYIMNHLNTVRLLHLYKGFSTASFNSFAWTLTKKGLKRMMGTSSCQKHQITPAILLSIRRSLNLSTPSHAALWALFTTAFFSFLRKSNLVAASASSFNCDLHLARHDIKFTDSGALLRIKWPKTRQKEFIYFHLYNDMQRSIVCSDSDTSKRIDKRNLSPTKKTILVPTAKLFSNPATKLLLTQRQE